MATDCINISSDKPESSGKLKVEAGTSEPSATIDTYRTHHTDRIDHTENIDYTEEEMCEWRKKILGNKSLFVCAPITLDQVRIFILFFLQERNDIILYGFFIIRTHPTCQRQQILWISVVTSLYQVVN